MSKRLDCLVGPREVQDDKNTKRKVMVVDHKEFLMMNFTMILSLEYMIYSLSGILNRFINIATESSTSF